MRLPFRIPLGAAETNPNPRSSPTTVPDKNVILIPDVEPGTDESPKSLVLALEGTTGNTATVQVWVADDPSNLKLLQTADLDVLANEKTNRKYYQYGTAIALTVGQAQLLVGTAGASTTVQLPCPKGRVYLQVTTGPVAAADLKVGWLGA